MEIYFTKDSGKGNAKDGVTGVAPDYFSF